VADRDRERETGVALVRVAEVIDQRVIGQLVRVPEAKDRRERLDKHLRAKAVLVPRSRAVKEAVAKRPRVGHAEAAVVAELVLALELVAALAEPARSPRVLTALPSPSTAKSIRRNCE
jgi:hypothetical protein